MLDDLLNFPNQLSNALAISSEINLDLGLSRPVSFLVIGMGGSGIGGEIAQTISNYQNGPQILISKDYKIPNYINKNTVVVAVSYSGNTEETLNAVNIAVKNGCNPICITSGGELGKIAKNKNFPLVKVPEGLQPRVALGYLSVPILAAFKDNGFDINLEKTIGEAVAITSESVEQFKPENDDENNPAKKIARALYKKIPIIYGTSGIGEVAARRWKCQINENSNSPAFYSVFPELDHNEINGWDLTKDMVVDFSLIILSDKEDHPRIKKRVALTTDILRDYFADVEEISSKGISVLARIFSLIILGDFISYYLAILNGVDPTIIEKIESLKTQLIS